MRRVRNRWGEPVFKFIACLLQHARDRYYIAGDDDSWLDSKYWVCAYANNQHAYAPFASPCLRSPVRVAEERAPTGRLGGDVTDDPAASSFAKAMETSIGTVTIIDPNAEVFGRIWCVLCASYHLSSSASTRGAGLRSALAQVLF